LGDEVEAVRRVIRNRSGGGRSTGTLLQPRLARISGSGVTPDSWPVSLCREQATRGGIMASSTRIPKAELTGIYGAMIKRMSRKMLGDVPDRRVSMGALQSR
jgi:hypothetical protein